MESGKERTGGSAMIQALLYSKKGKEQKEVSLNTEIFGAPINERLLALVEKAYAANLRRGTASSKSRGEVRGGGKKPWKQKGTGRARVGSIRSPIWKGGGVVFGPRPRDYSVALPEGMKRKALISALSLRAKEKNVLLVEEARPEKPKTKEFVGMLKALPLEQKRTLCVVKETDPVLKRAAQNVSGLCEVKLARDLNAHHVLQWPKLLIEEQALPVIESRLLRGKEAKEKGEAKATKVRKPARKKSSKS
jgi:large subunit ribosomal protein L4